MASKGYKGQRVPLRRLRRPHCRLLLLPPLLVRIHRGRHRIANHAKDVLQHSSGGRLQLRPVTLGHAARARHS